ncbi:hypothetical protein Ahy_A09g041738 [Arachis hypogaea]|uniref:Reverse transcriptase zinc-binding domain-containing protein n=1 Tax=Arachis hypogaea TaxID=3818 RepID=A0A445BDL9_ARAHY|nr:hypothetical protein Ahy_A09g041738 [Arachis hypogaea]
MGEDILAWLLTSDGAFTIKSACSLYLSPSDNSKAKVKRHMSQDGSCVICGEATESMLHVIRDYRIARQTWMSIDVRLQIGNYFNTLSLVVRELIIPIPLQRGSLPPSPFFMHNKFSLAPSE